MDKEAFMRACSMVDTTRVRDSIGILGEKSLHAALKWYFEPHSECHEIKIGDFVADIVGERGIIEIQTRSFAKMAKKLTQFLELSRVTVVYPIIVNKRLICIDDATGAVTSKRMSSKKGRVFDVFDELYAIRPLLGHENLTICLLLINADEYRIYGGEREKRRKPQRTAKGYFRSDRFPTELLDEIYLSRSEDFAALLPTTLPEEFTAADLAREARLDSFSAGSALKTLREMGACEIIGKRNRAALYKKRSQ